MGSEQTITHDFDRLLAQYPGFFKELVSYVDDIRQYGTVKQAIVEAEKKLADARAASDEFQVEMIRRHQAVADSHATKQMDLDAAIIARKAEIDRMMVDASEEAAARIQAARDKVDEILAAGYVARKAVDERVADAQQQAVALEADIAAKSGTLDGIAATIGARQGELDLIENSIAELRAKIA